MSNLVTRAPRSLGITPEREVPGEQRKEGDEFPTDDEYLFHRLLFDQLEPGNGKILGTHYWHVLRRRASDKDWEIATKRFNEIKERDDTT